MLNVVNKNWSATASSTALLHYELSLNNNIIDVTIDFKPIDAFGYGLIRHFD